MVDYIKPTTAQEWERFLQFWTYRNFVVACLARLLSLLEPPIPLRKEMVGWLSWCPQCSTVFTEEPVEACPRCHQPLHPRRVLVAEWQVTCPACHQRQRFGMDGIAVCRCGYRDLFYLVLRRIQKHLRAGNDAKVMAALTEVLYHYYKKGEPRKEEKVAQPEGEAASR